MTAAPTDRAAGPPGVARIAAAGTAYFALAFVAGFVLGTVRVLAVVPRVGERTAELLEAPLMLAVVVTAARFVVRRFVPDASRAVRAAVGALGVTLLLAVELTVVLSLRGLSPAEYAASRDPVAGAIYVALLAAFAAMPALVRGRPEA
ncbi:MAG: hypothetical protein U1F58_08320 [Burkholderiales bacterium]